MKKILKYLRVKNRWASWIFYYMNLYHIMEDYPIGTELCLKGNEYYPGRICKVFGYSIFADCINIEFVESGAINVVRLEELLEGNHE